MFSLSKKADYGLIALKHLAQHTDESVSAREIASGVPDTGGTAGEDSAAAGPKRSGDLPAGYATGDMSWVAILPRFPSWM